MSAKFSDDGGTGRVSTNSVDGRRAVARDDASATAPAPIGCAGAATDSNRPDAARR